MRGKTIVLNLTFAIVSFVLSGKGTSLVFNIWAHDIARMYCVPSIKPYDIGLVKTYLEEKSYST